MLVLTRKCLEAVVVGGTGSFQQLLRVTVLGFSNGKVKLGFDVDPTVPVHRAEVWERMRAENGSAGSDPTAGEAAASPG